MTINGDQQKGYASVNGLDLYTVIWSVSHLPDSQCFRPPHMLVGPHLIVGS
jgi:hypothetical protein